MLEVHGLAKNFDGFQAVGDVSFTVPQGSISAIIGPNGAGKTTLFNLITGHLSPDAGRVVFTGRDATGIAPHDLCRLGMGRSFQRTNIVPRLTVFENVQAAFVSHCGRGWNLLTPVARLYRGETEALLQAVGLLGQAGEVSGFLSHGGQKQLELGAGPGTGDPAARRALRGAGPARGRPPGRADCAPQARRPHHPARRTGIDDQRDAPPGVGRMSTAIARGVSRLRVPWLRVAHPGRPGGLHPGVECGELETRRHAGGNDLGARDDA